jgi:peptide/nickel transport system substrate-binding protein
MEAQLYNDRYVNVLYYPNTLEAYRSDVISSMEMQPQPGGIYDGQDGYWSWWSATPTAAATSHSSALPVVAAAIIVAALVAAGVLLVLRRRSTVQERE